MSPTLYMLVGLPGSGKSQYAIDELKAVKPGDRGVVQINQDEMGGDGHLRAFCECLTNRDSVVVDRVNFDREQRARYIGPARARGYRIVCIWFDVDQAVCLERLSRREGHPSVSRSDDHERILGGFAGRMVLPEADEYDELRVA